MVDLYHMNSSPQECGSMIIRGKYVTFYYCTSYFMGEHKYTWRADCDSITIASVCKTKKECIAEARHYLRQKAKKR